MEKVSVCLIDGSNLLCNGGSIGLYVTDWPRV